MMNSSRFTAASDRGGITRAAMAALAHIAPRRVGRASEMGSEPVNVERLRQPQDGAPNRTKLASITAHLQGDFLREPEDARLTGGTRSLARRLMGLNMRNKPKKAPGISVVGQLPHPKVA